ncbi:FAD:protein FMN transferase [Dysgonomonas sp. Marseille-P4677]|uniref:FAD:protein FMN transferase n=1 Tax=Dysgonomonas sp. Marseille-P4677 TaxID=2364790 RepID=UPI001911901D|nr:FAD:protein FMN transferase [Dysgonomonas sp. Marseille-P4677]MBK5721738.1 FAD:protein FMN transferase [Dysgonomonas sp. Marseille-P4677]
MRYIYLFLASLFLLTACKGNQKKENTYIEEHGEIFHTTYSVKYEYSHSLKLEIEAELKRFDDSLNPFKSTSIISKVNNNEDVVLDTLFTNVFNRAEEVSQISDGLFDITISPLINAWGFGFKNMNNVTPRMIDSLKQKTGYRKISLQGGKIEKTDESIQINTSAIAKGYSSDVIAKLLESYGIQNYMVEIGGEVVAKGVSPKGKCWQIGISTPLGKDIYDYDKLQTIVRLCNKSMATSGNYRNYYIKDGRKYAHTINPKTGYPSENNTLSATVIANDCMSADAFATVFMLADTLLIRDIAEKENLSYLLIMGAKDSSHIIVKSKDFDDYIVK